MHFSDWLDPARQQRPLGRVYFDVSIGGTNVGLIQNT